MRPRLALCLALQLALTMGTFPVAAQQFLKTQHDAPGLDRRTPADLAALIAKSIPQAKASPDGFAVVELEGYPPGQRTELVVRVKPGLVEWHQHASDLIIVLQGEGTIATGGTMADPKDTAAGERRAHTMTGATVTPLHKGDFVHIDPAMTHQASPKPGTVLAYYVVKGIEPAK